MERAAMTLEPVRPSLTFLPEYKAALERGWSPDNLREAAVIREELDKIATDTPISGLPEIGSRSGQRRIAGRDPRRRRPSG
jgi:hypothetical protein